MNTPLHIGLIGCGKISDAYFAGLKPYSFLRVVACADLDLARAHEKAKQHGVEGMTVDALLADPRIDLVINLTVPQAHAEVNERALRASKHVYTEKPFALDSASGRRVLAVAREQNRLVGCAPDTFLGGGLQTVRKLIDDGAIGRPIAASAFMLGRGPESWHPSPEFFYKAGAGPMFDMGPYYITALVNFIGPVTRVSGTAKASFPERIITSQPLAGKRVAVEVPTHYAGVMDFAGGATATIVTSFDTYPYPFPRIVIFGTEGTLEAPDPNTFHGPVRLRNAATGDYDEVPLTHTDERGRGSGVADMALAIRTGRAHRASGELAQHVLEVMEAFDVASRSGHYVNLTSTCARPAALPVGLAPHELDAAPAGAPPQRLS
ncbi:MAG TPA: Gfo/Idh/MocA family oxidoreductase [Opitutaceae bacterium]